ncbi:polymorphic toxin type 50 domain-containing protein [Marinobacterium iners]|uniref:polymorphic toxin type 50 domain-containing protein n=1 Tax=Marinobacterium iners TaxID=48076 RepID=UPI001587F1BF
MHYKKLLDSPVIERVNFQENIGKYVDPSSGNSSSTTNGIIHYSKDGVHIVPARP